MKTLTEHVIETGSLSRGLRAQRAEKKLWNPPPAHIQQKQVDAMPKEVATEMLLLNGSNMMSSRDRRAYARARCRVFESDRPKQDPNTHLERKLKAATWAQLVKWERRSIIHRKGVQDAHQILVRRIEKLESETPDQKDKEAVAKLGIQIALAKKALALLDLKAAQLDVFWDAVDTEKGRRGLLISNLRELRLNEMAAKLETATVNN